MPLPYIIWNQYLEPLASLGGIVFGLYDPVGFLTTFTPSIISPSAFGLSNSGQPLPAISQLLLTQTFSLYATFIVIEFCLLRWATYTPLLNNLPEVRMRIWKGVIWTSFASDLFYLYASWVMYTSPEAGPMGMELFMKPWLWEKNEWTVLAASWVPFLFRISFLAGVGLNQEGQKQKLV